MSQSTRKRLSGNSRKMVGAAAMAMLAVAGAGCTPLQKGFQDGVSDGLAAALSAMIEAPVTGALEGLF